MGKIKTTQTDNKTKDNKLKILCQSCECETNHVVVQSVDTTGSEVVGYCNGNRNMPETIDWADNYQIVQCKGCDTISFRHQSWFSEYDDYESKGVSERIYPKRSSSSLSLKDFWNIPHQIRRIYRETIESFNYESYTLCVAGLRAIVEGVCSEQNIQDGPVEFTKPDGTIQINRRNNLQGKIAGLCETGILTKGNSEILHEHRYLGNDAVHELDQPSTSELKLAIEIIEHTLENLYEIPEKAAELKFKKSRRKNA